MRLTLGPGGLSYTVGRVSESGPTAGVTTFCRQPNHCTDGTPSYGVIETMARPSEAVSVLVALEFVIMSALVLLLAPLEVALPLVPLMLVFLVALQSYRS